jgi:hypothetical protein
MMMDKMKLSELYDLRQKLYDVRPKCGPPCAATIGMLINMYNVIMCLAFVNQEIEKRLL